MSITKHNDETDASASDKKPIITGRDIITKYKENNDPACSVTYRKICSTVTVIENWEDNAKCQFLEQLLDLSDILDASCNVLVVKLVELNWSVIPAIIFQKFIKLLCELAVRQVCFTELVFKAAVGNFQPVISKKVKVAAGDNETAIEEITSNFSGAAHGLIAHILKCVPMSATILLSVLQRGSPHVSQAATVHRYFTRNALQLAEYAPRIAEQVILVIIKNLILYESYAVKSDNMDNVGGMSIFASNIDSDELAESSSADALKLDQTIHDLVTYISLKNDVTVDASDCSWIICQNLLSREELFVIFTNILEKEMLMSVHVKYTSFIWLFLASLEEEYCARLLNHIWALIVRLPSAQSDVKKSHGAAAYLSGFISRAKFVDTSTSLQWLDRIAKWCLQYVNNCSSLMTSAGASRHGLFYAMSQTLFTIFSFRYREYTKTQDLDEIRGWGLSRIVHCSLDPLKFVSRPVGLCFAAITRSIQLVYCNHVLPTDHSPVKPFEPMFPFDNYKYPICAPTFTPIVRKFSPLAEDASVINGLLISSDGNISDSENMDFLEADDCDPLRLGSTDSLKYIPRSSFLTVYSTSPGLRHFNP